jgi:signal transduction histidine kinase
MGEFPVVARAIFVTLIFFQASVLAARFPACEARGELVRFTVFLILMGLRLAVPASSPLFTGISVAIIWAAGAHLAALLENPLRNVWGAANATFLLILSFASILGYRATVPFAAFYALFSGILLCYPMALLADVTRGSRRGIHILLLVSGTLSFLAGAGEAVLCFLGRPFADFGSWTISFISICTGWLVFQEGYLQKSGRRAFIGRETIMRAAYARLLETENALVLQDRLIVSGLLAMGAAHEFKNVLAHIQATAESALADGGIEHKNRCLRLLAEHADTGGRAAADFLVRFSREGREEARPLDVSELIGGFAKTARAGLRADGVLMRSEVQNGLKVIGRRGEVEQVLLNLAVNAVECFKRRRIDGQRTIEIVCRGLQEAVLIEVRDNAGGVPSDAAEKLFQISPSDSGNTGLGLYLSRSLAERNGGSLTYVSLDGGSCFRLTLPYPPVTT